VKSVLLEGPMLRNLMVAGADLFFERWDDAGINTICVMPYGEHARPVTAPGAASLITVEDHRLICREPDGRIVFIARHDLARTPIYKIDPLAAAVAITPEQIVWCTQDTRGMTGRGPHDPGQLWRWWRGTDKPEYLGEHPGSMPELVVATRAPIAATAMTSDVYFAADTKLGVIDQAGLRWLAEEAQGFQNLVTGPDALYYTTHGRVVRRDLTTGESRTIYRTEIPLAVAVADDKLVVGCNFVYERGTRAQESSLVIVDLETGASTIVARELGRPCELATDSLGIYVLEYSEAWERPVDRLTFVPWDEPAIEHHVPAEVPLDAERWQFQLLIMWWMPDERAGQFTIDGTGAWQLHVAGGPHAGTLDTTALRALQAWCDDARETTTAYPDLSQDRGWLVSWGTETWHRRTTDRASPAARAVIELCTLIAVCCPAFAQVNVD
jgi:hypothetical protein